MQRFEFFEMEFSDWKSYTIHDKKENKVVCHFLPENGTDYCKEIGNKIVELLNKQ
ncbi:MAG: hypothetical protein KA275_08465 [Chitinophagaceae bacterium]|nr:hypothetical protein [Chitinophagaceae bacterium]